MRTIEAIRRSGVGITPGQTVREAAGLMEQTGVGSLAVIDDGRLVGIVTDRDLVRRALARELPADARVDAVMSSPAITINADADHHDAFALFGSYGVRRLAVVQDGRFVGMVTVDDLLVELARDLGDLSRPISAEIDTPHRDSVVPSVP
jgi:CBS domain-containing protein